jgi:hypothetical protein
MVREGNGGVEGMREGQVEVAVPRPPVRNIGAEARPSPDVLMRTVGRQRQRTLRRNGAGEVETIIVEGGDPTR